MCAAVACQNNNEPKTADTTGTVNNTSAVHPAGTPSSQISSVGGRPFGVRVTGIGDVLVTEQDLNQAVHTDSVGAHVNDVSVGGDPGDVIANKAGTQGYVSNFFDGTISFVDLSNNTVQKTVSVSPSNAYRLALSPDGSTLYVSSTDGNLYTVNTSSRTAGPAKGIGGSLQGLALNHAGNAVYVSSTGGTIARLDASSLAISKAVALNCSAQDVALSTDDAELYVACENGSVQILDATSLATKDSVVLSSSDPFGLAVSPDNAQIYVTGPQAGRLTIIDRANRTIVKSLILTGVPRRVAFNAHGNRAYIANEANWVDIIE